MNNEEFEHFDEELGDNDLQWYMVRACPCNYSRL